MGIPIQGGFADVEETSFEALPAGTYEASIFKGEIRESKSEKHAGSQYISWEINITEEPYTRRKVWYNTSLVDEARGMLKSFLKGVGYTDDELNSDDFELNIEDIVGRPIRVVVKKGTNPNTQEENNNVRRVLPPGESSGTDLP